MWWQEQSENPYNSSAKKSINYKKKMLRRLSVKKFRFELSDFEYL